MTCCSGATWGMLCCSWRRRGTGLPKGASQLPGATASFRELEQYVKAAKGSKWARRRSSSLGITMYCSTTIGFLALAFGIQPSPEHRVQSSGIDLTLRYDSTTIDGRGRRIGERSRLGASWEICNSVIPKRLTSTYSSPEPEPETEPEPPLCAQFCDLTSQRKGE